MRNSVLVFLTAVFVLACGAPSSATVNPDPDEIGLYFDINADTVCMNVAPNIPFDAYLIITNPSSAEVWGIEFSMCTEFTGGSESQMFKLSEVWSSGFVDPAVIHDWCLDGRAIGFFDPVPQVGANVVLVRLQYMILVDMGVKFFLRPYPVETIEDGLPAYAGVGGVVLPLGISSGDPGLPVAAVNGDCDVVSVESRTFSGLKCLFR